MPLNAASSIREVLATEYHKPPSTTNSASDLNARLMSLPVTPDANGDRGNRNHR